MATVESQLRFVSEWFNEFSDLQKSDFLPIVRKELNEVESVTVVNGIADNLDQVHVTNDQVRPHSLFEIRVSFFREWYRRWPEEVRHQFLDRIGELDPNFSELLSKDISYIPVVTDELH